MFGKLKTRVRTWHEKRLVKKLKACGLFNKPGDINEKEKTIHLGLYSFVWHFASANDRLALQLLQQWYGWKMKEEVMNFGTFNPSDN